MNRNAYTRLPGARRGFLRRNSNWAADDHILLISGTRFHERYQRIFYRDVLGIIVERTRRFSAPWFWFPIPLWVLTAVIVFSVRAIPVAFSAWVTLVVMGILLLVQLLLIFFGSCRVWIATDVGNLEAPAVTRRWQAKRFVAKLQSRIQAVQPDTRLAEAEASGQ